MTTLPLTRSADDTLSDDRPRKRQRLSPPASPQSTPASSESPRTISSQPLPPELLLNIPNQLLHPPTHQLFPASIAVSLCALRRVLKLPIAQLTPSTEIRARTGIIELGILALESGFIGQNHERDTQWPWTGGLLDEVESSLTHALHLSATYPTLSLYTAHLNLLHVQFLTRTPGPVNFKLIRGILKRLLATALEKEPVWGSHVVYQVYLATIDHYLQFESSTGEGIAMTLLARMTSHARSKADHLLLTFCEVLKLRLCFIYSRWDEAGEALRASEQRLCFDFSSSSASDHANVASPLNPATPNSHPPPPHPSYAALKVSVLLLGVLYWCIKGSSGTANPRLELLHTELDAGLLRQIDSRGRFPIPLESDPHKPLWVVGTPPSLLSIQAYLVSAEAKHDPLGHKIKRRIFALEGIKVAEKGLRRYGADLTPGTSLPHLSQLEVAMAKIKADCLCQLISVALMKSEFQAVSTHLNDLVTWSLKYQDQAGMWDEFCPRITLFQAQLFHGLGNYDRAIKCYQVSGALARGELDCTPSLTLRDAGENRPSSPAPDSSSRASASEKQSKSALVTPKSTKVGPSSSWSRSTAPSPPSIGYHPSPLYSSPHSRTPLKRADHPYRAGTLTPTPLAKVSRMNPISPSQTSSPAVAFRQHPQHGETRDRDNNKGQWVELMSKVGEVLLRLGRFREEESNPSLFNPEAELIWLRDQSLSLSEACEHEQWGGQLEALGVFTQAIACFCFHGYREEDKKNRVEGDGEEDEGEKWGLDAKAHMRALLQLTKNNDDSYLRALSMGLIASFYLYTAEDHVQSMLNTTEMLATSLGASAPKKGASDAREPCSGSDNGWGNLPLRLWVVRTKLGLAERLNDHKKIPALKKMLQLLEERLKEMDSIVSQVVA